MLMLGLLSSIAIFLGTAIVVIYLTKTKVFDRRLAQTELETRRLLDAAREEAERLKKEKLLEAREEIHSLRSQFDDSVRESKRESGLLEARLTQRAELLDKKEHEAQAQDRQLRQRASEVGSREKALAQKEEKLNSLIEDEMRTLEKTSGMTVEDARKQLMKNVELEALHGSAGTIKRIEEETLAVATREARKIIVQAIQRCAAEHSAESSVSVVDLPNEEMKGRIIGREGRNIRALEQATGVDLIVDDTPGAIILSGFDPLRREIARLAITRLLSDGRIHPARIEEVVNTARTEVQNHLLQDGETAAFEVGIHDFHPEILKMLGRLRYRTSYGQNVLNHSVEVSYLAGIMASECRADVAVAKRAALVHDIGKAVDRQIEGTHIQLGVELLRKYGETPEVIHAMECHHFDVEFRTLEAVLVQAADAVSAARPGARREVLESYVKRLEKLEALAGAFSGVAKAFALQAGREIRIIVESSKVSDEQAFWLAKDITRKIEEDLQYPGQIKVTVIREIRVVDYAK